MRALFSPVYPVLAQISLSHKKEMSSTTCSREKEFWNFEFLKLCFDITSKPNARILLDAQFLSNVLVHAGTFFPCLPCPCPYFLVSEKKSFLCSREKDFWNFELSTLRIRLPAAKAPLQAATVPTQRRYSANDLQRCHGANDTSVRCNAATAPTKRSYGANDLQRS